MPIAALAGAVKLARRGRSAMALEESAKKAELPPVTPSGARSAKNSAPFAQRGVLLLFVLWQRLGVEASRRMLP